jgi:hypothetical protein
MGLGGDLTATSEVRKGTIFKLSLCLEIVEVALSNAIDESELNHDVSPLEQIIVDRNAFSMSALDRKSDSIMS